LFVRKEKRKEEKYKEYSKKKKEKPLEIFSVIY
jgi:hypothetical protein